MLTQYVSIKASRLGVWVNCIDLCPKWPISTAAPASSCTPPAFPISRRLASVRLRNSTPVCRLEGLLHFALLGGLVHGWEVLAFENWLWRRAIGG